MVMNNFWKDKNDRVVILQSPNLPLIVWFVAYLLTLLPFSPFLLSLCGAVSFGALFTWAWMEISSGASPFRRLLGVAVLALSVLLRMK